MRVKLQIAFAGLFMQTLLFAKDVCSDFSMVDNCLGSVASWLAAVGTRWLHHPKSTWSNNVVTQIPEFLAGVKRSCRCSSLFRIIHDKEHCSKHECNGKQAAHQHGRAPWTTSWQNEMACRKRMHDCLLI